MKTKTEPCLGVVVLLCCDQPDNTQHQRQSVRFRENRLAMRPGITVAPLVVVLLAVLLPGLTLAAAPKGPIPHVLRINWGDPIPDTLDPQLSHSGHWGIS